MFQNVSETFLVPLQHIIHILTFFRQFSLKCMVFTRSIDNTKKPLRHHRGDSVVVFQYYQEMYVTLRKRVRFHLRERWNYSRTSSPTGYS